MTRLAHGVLLALGLMLAPMLAFAQVDPVARGLAASAGATATSAAASAASAAATAAGVSVRVLRSGDTMTGTLGLVAPGAGDSSALAVSSAWVRAYVQGLALAPLASPGLTGTPTGPTPSPGDASTKLATTAFDAAAVLVEKTRALAAEAPLAPLASPTLTGSPAAPTDATVCDTTTQIATVAATTACVNANAPWMLPCVTTLAVVGTNVTLSNAQARCMFVVVTGTLTAAVQLVYPGGAGMVFTPKIENETTAGSFNLQAKVNGGTGGAVVIPPATSPPAPVTTSISCDGISSLLCSKS